MVITEMVSAKIGKRVLCGVLVVVWVIVLCMRGRSWPGTSAKNGNSRPPLPPALLVGIRVSGGSHSDSLSLQFVHNLTTHQSTVLATDNQNVGILNESLPVIDKHNKKSQLWSTQFCGCLNLTVTRARNSTFNDTPQVVSNCNQYHKHSYRVPATRIVQATLACPTSNGDQGFSNSSDENWPSLSGCDLVPIDMISSMQQWNEQDLSSFVFVDIDLHVAHSRGLNCSLLDWSASVAANETHPFGVSTNIRAIHQDLFNGYFGRAHGHVRRKRQAPASGLSMLAIASAGVVATAATGSAAYFVAKDHFENPSDEESETDAQDQDDDEGHKEHKNCHRHKHKNKNKHKDKPKFKRKNT